MYVNLAIKKGGKKSLLPTPGEISEKPPRVAFHSVTERWKGGLLLLLLRLESSAPPADTAAAALGPAEKLTDPGHALGPGVIHGASSL